MIYSGYWLVFVTLLLGYFYSDFSRARIGPLFALDFSFAVAVALCLWEKARTRQLRLPAALTLAPLLPITLFSAWGALRLAADIFVFTGAPLPLGRVLQHSIIFVYPALWVILGYFVARGSRRFVELATYAAIVGVGLGYLIRGTTYLEHRKLVQVNCNISVGPLFVLPAIYFTERAFAAWRARRSARQPALMALGSAVIAFQPFWEMWTTSMQRTSLLILGMNLLLAPLILVRFAWKRAFAVSALLLALFGLGSGLYLASKRPAAGHAPSPGSAPNQIVSALNHADDLHQPGRNATPLGTFQGRFRAFLWREAIRDWRTAPLLGIGFVPELPAYIMPGIKNDGTDINFVDENGRPTNPVSGPHNSYLTVLARMGLVGCALLLFAGLHWLRELGRLQRSRESDFLRMALTIIPINGAVHAFFNIGFESPHNSVLMWLFFGIGLWVARSPESREA